MARIRIVRRPLGEAPEWVRDAWIGLELPLTLESERQWATYGVLSGPPGFFRRLVRSLTGAKGNATKGYAINARAAVDLLAQRHPDAAEWWWMNVSATLDGKQFFIFDADACELLAG